MRIILLSAFALFLLLPENIQAQVTVKTGYISSSRYKDENGQYPGKGDMCFVEGNVNIPVSQKMNERNQPTLWMISAGGSYTAMNNKNLQSYIDQIINMQLSVTNIRPISKKWLLLTTVGAGVYTSSDVKLKNVLGQGGVIFIRQFKSNLSLGDFLRFSFFASKMRIFRPFQSLQFPKIFLLCENNNTRSILFAGICNKNNRQMTIDHGELPEASLP